MRVIRCRHIRSHSEVCCHTQSCASGHTCVSVTPVNTKPHLHGHGALMHHPFESDQGLRPAVGRGLGGVLGRRRRVGNGRDDTRHMHQGNRVPAGMFLPQRILSAAGIKQMRGRDANQGGQTGCSRGEACWKAEVKIM